LYGLGFASVAVLEGGIQQWYAEGYAVEGTWLTPTPDEVGPPWSVTPIVTTTVVPLRDATSASPIVPEPTEPLTLTMTVAVTPTSQTP
jgi:3-mercaptopyruvate sulfurtransferase SseA